MYERSCKKCRETKPIGAFRLIRRRGKMAGPKLSGKCSECLHEERLQRRNRAEAASPGLRRGRQMRERHGNRWAQHVQQQICPLSRILAPRLVVLRGFSVSRKRRFPDEFYALSAAEQWRWRYANDPEFNLRERLRVQARKHRRFGCINTRLREGLDGGATPVFEFLGYTSGDLKTHLEGLFTDAMDWECFNAGLIHIDHIKPLKLFDLEDEQQVWEAWQLSNLQPLWADENLAKGCRLAA